MVGLRQQREAVAVEPVDQPQLPERLVAVERLGEDAAGEIAQLLLVARLRQPGVAQVVAQVEVRVVDPARAALPERDEREALAEPRHEVQAAVDVLEQLDVAGRLALEDDHRGDVHVRRVVLEVEERGVEPAESVFP